MKKHFPKVAVWLCLCMPFVAVLFKHFFLQGYIVGDNAYQLQFWQGVLRSLPYLPLQLAPIALVFCFGFLFRERGRYLYGMIVNAICTVIAVIDLVYFRAYNVLPAVIMLPLAGSQGGSSTILQTLPTLFVWSDLLFLVDFAVWGVLFHCVSRYGWRKEYNPKYRPHLTALTAAVSAFVLAFVPILSCFSWDNGAYRRLYITSDTVQKSLYFSFLGFHGEDFAQTASGKVTTTTMSEWDKDVRQTYFDWKLQDEKDSSFFGQSAGKNVLIIQVESLENFVIGQSLSGQEITPNLNRLARGGYHFSNIYEQVKCGNSSDCDFMMMTSLLPPNKSYAFGSYTENEYLTLPTILKDNGGYHSSYFHGATDSIWNYQDMLSGTLGVDNVHMDYEQDHLLNGYLSDESFVRQTLKKLDEQPLTLPFYAHVVTCSSHIPFMTPQRLSMVKELSDHPMGRYLQAMHYVDEQIGKLLDGMEQRGLLKDTLVMVVGDHGGIHKYYPHYISGLDRKVCEDWFLKDEKYTLPLIFYNTDIQNPKNFSVIGGQIDVLPSLLHLLGVPPEQYEATLLGRNLFGTTRSFCIQDDGVLYGTLSENDYEVAKTVYYLSDTLIRSNTVLNSGEE